MSIIHFSYTSDGGASRAARRASLACEAAGITSTFAFVDGEALAESDVNLRPPPPTTSTPEGIVAEVLGKQVQWEFIPARRTAISNTLFSLPYPGIDVSANRLFSLADIIHLHWPTWGITPAAIGRLLDAGRHVFWTLHDCWPMTGGCHYPRDCEQYRTTCFKCSQLQNDLGLAPNTFAEKLRQYGSGGSLTIVSPTEWMAGVARNSAILGKRPVHVVRNAIELTVFKPPADRVAMRQAMGIAPKDLMLLFGSFDLVERRKGVALLIEALAGLAEDGRLAAALGQGARVHVGMFGKSPLPEEIPGALLVQFGHVTDDAVLADIYGAADVVCLPSLEDNYPNVIVEAFACGTPCVGYSAGGMAEMIEDGVTGVLVPEVGSVAALQAGLVRFAKQHFRSATMRTACRASAKRNNGPGRVGRQLRALYEGALGRPLVAADPVLRKRIVRTMANAPVPLDVHAGGDLLQFPLNMAVIDMAGRSPQAAKFATSQRSQAAGQHRLISVHTFHDHHSGRSGPYQFLRHLPPDRYLAKHMLVPLGTQLAGDRADLCRRAGALMGVTSFGRQGNAWQAEAEVLMLCAREPVDLVHFIDGELGGWLLAGMPDSIFDGGRRPAMVATFHQPEQLLRGMINADLIRRFDGVIALCKTQGDFLLNYVAPERLFLVPHGIDSSFFRLPGPDHAAPPRNAFRLLLVGHWLRDIKAVLAAFTALAAEMATELVIIAPNFPPIRPDPRITILSGLSDEALREAYWDADLLVLPLRDATANNAILEAMACGLPVVSTDVGGVRECTSDAAVLCPPNDPDSIVGAVLQLARDAERRAMMRAQGRARAEQLDWSIIGQAHDRIYQTLLLRSRQVPLECAQAPPAAATRPSRSMILNHGLAWSTDLPSSDPDRDPPAGKRASPPAQVRSRATRAAKRRSK